MGLREHSATLVTLSTPWCGATLDKPTSKTAEQWVLEGLHKALVSGKEIPLLSAGGKTGGTGLFPDEKGIRKKAIDRCLVGPPALLTVVRTEETSSGKRTQVRRFVVITQEGIDFLFSKISTDAAAELLAQCSRQAAEQLLALQAQIDKLVHARSQLLDNLQAVVHHLAEAANRAQTVARETAERASRLKSRMDMLPLPQSILPEAPARPPLRLPTTEDERGFRQRAAQELVFAWQEAEAAARDPLERALFNVGAEPIGRPGEATQFVGRLHECNEPVFSGDHVEIVEPGWLLRDESGGYLLAHAKTKVVKPTGNS